MKTLKKNSRVDLAKVVGSLLSEVVNTIIPDRKADRLTKYVIELEEHLVYLDQNKLSYKIQNEQYIALLEDGYIQASRAMTDTRRSYIASVVAIGLNGTEIEANLSVYILGLLSELNDIEIIWLRYFLYQTVNDDEEFREKHSDIIYADSKEFESDEQWKEHMALEASYREHLERLGLIESHINIDTETDMPVFDTLTGKPEITYQTITTLGLMLLRHVGLSESEYD
ncbi:hypothetical protein [Vibrio owensii]|uniref:hypothetical protein n=1 Tax=Vibrio owensii TaxID=696485 RepID=UPI0018F13C50|nr:hypothetical protein [Vibrio owensii]